MAAVAHILTTRDQLEVGIDRKLKSRRRHREICKHQLTVLESVTFSNVLTTKAILPQLVPAARTVVRHGLCASLSTGKASDMVVVAGAPPIAVAVLTQGPLADLCLRMV